MLSHRLQRLSAIAMLSLTLVLGGLWLDYQRFLDAPLSLPADGMIYQVKPGSGVGRIAAELAALGVLAHPLYLRLHARGSALSRQLHAGEFRLAAGLTPRQLLPLFASGRVVEYPLTLVEGWTFREVRQALAADPVLVHDTQDMTDAQLMAAIGQAGQHPEGRFFPDTYRFPRGARESDVLRRARARMQQVLADAWAERAEGLPLKSADEALILASIVEKETGLASERDAIAGVFTRRLQKGMRLQTDPTVIYGLGERFDGNLRRRDLRQDTPYNTYTRAGLPPTPICMPGAEAIRAATKPAAGKALYFVARGDGSHHFSATLAAHNDAVRRYQLKRNK